MADALREKFTFQHEAATAAPQGVLTYVGPDGHVYFGNVEYDSTDFGWAYCFPAMVLTDGPVPAFTVGKAIPIADNTTIALLGDWGGWNGPAQSIAAAAKSCDCLIHLGNVYYAGTDGSLAGSVALSLRCRRPTTATPRVAM
jgi:hypothetical protein